MRIKIILTDMRNLLLIFALSLSVASLAQVQTINRGTTPNDHTGDNAYIAFGKVNANFVYVVDVLESLQLTQADSILIYNYVNAQLAGKQPLDADLTTIANISPSDGDVIQRIAGQWARRTIAQLKTDLETAGAASQQYVTDAIQNAKGKIYYTSVAGAVSDADLSLGSVTFGTDNTTAIQSLLSIAGPKTIVVDGKYSVGELFVNSNTRIVALPGCGMILRNHTSRPMFTNANSVTGLNSQGADEYIEILGGIWNGNGYNTGTNGSDLFDVAAGGSAVNGSAQLREEMWRFWGVEHLTIRDVTVYGPRTYWINTINNRYLTVENFSLNFGSVSSRDPYNYDGIHVNGSAQFIHINDGSFHNVKDDNIALNTAEANPGTYGNITDVFINNITLYSDSYGVRISSIPGQRIDRVRISGVHGDSKNYVVIINNFTSIATATTGVVTIEDIDVNMPSAPNQSINAYIFVEGIVEHLILRNITRRDFAGAFPLIKFGGSTTAVRKLSVNGMYMRNTGTTFTTPLITMTTGTVNFLDLSDVSIDNTNQSTSSLLSMTGGTIGMLRLNGIVANNITNIVNHSGGTLSEILASNIKHAATTSPVSFVTSGTIPYLNLSNYHGTTKTSGTFTTTEGDAYGAGGSGDVVGPVSATADVPVLFSGTTGKVIKNSTPTGTGNPVLQTAPTLSNPVVGTQSPSDNSTKAASTAYVEAAVAAGGGGGGVPTSRTLTINGTTQDLSANRSWTLATGGDVAGPSSAIDGGAVVYDGPTGKLIKAAPGWVDFSASMSVAGAGTPTIAFLHYKVKDNDEVHVYGRVSGVSNVASTITFNLPFALHSSYGSGGLSIGVIVMNSNVNGSSRLVGSGGSAVATVTATPVTDNFTASAVNARGVWFWFVYRK